MLELARTTTAYPERKTSSPYRAASPALVVGQAQTLTEVEAVQRLRFEIFSHDLGAVFPHGQAGCDVDHYDRYCEHVIVRNQDDSRVIGTYRILTPRKRPARGWLLCRTRIRPERPRHVATMDWSKWAASA